MQNKSRALILIGAIGVVVFGSQFGAHYGRAVWGNRDIWWTPRSLALSLDETGQHVKLFVDGVLLGDLVEQGALLVKDAGGGYETVDFDDIDARLNNWHKTKASFLHLALHSAVLLGGSTVCLAWGLVEWRSEKKRGQDQEPAGR